MDHLIAEIPPDADLSAMPLAVDKGMLAATAATPYCALRVSVAPDGLNMFIDVTWDRT